MEVRDRENRREEGGWSERPGKKARWEEDGTLDTCTSWFTPLLAPGPQTHTRPQELVELASEAILVDGDYSPHVHTQESDICMNFRLLCLCQFLHLSMVSFHICDIGNAT